jgi:hypothetical protein
VPYNCCKQHKQAKLGGTVQFRFQILQVTYHSCKQILAEKPTLVRYVDIYGMRTYNSCSSKYVDIALQILCNYNSCKRKKTFKEISCAKLGLLLMYWTNNTSEAESTTTTNAD